MKKCPYCAEEIQDEAIICRYCGRDFPNSEKLASIKEVHKNPPNKKSKRSIWATGAIISGILTAIFAVDRVFTAPNANELLGDLTLGLIATFLFFWFVAACVVAIWRKSGETSWGRPVLFIGVIFLFVAGVALYRSMANGNTYAVTSQPATSTQTIYIAPNSLAAAFLTDQATPNPLSMPIVLYSDDFSNSQSGWANNDFLGYLDGKYVIYYPNLHTGNLFLSSCANRNFTDAVLTVDAEYASGMLIILAP